MALAECLHQLDLERQMLRVRRLDSVQLIQQLGRDPLRLAMRHSVHHPVPDRFDGSEERLGFEPIQ
jgi:hypothetical protein